MYCILYITLYLNSYLRSPVPPRATTYTALKNGIKKDAYAYATAGCKNSNAKLVAKRFDLFYNCFEEKRSYNNEYFRKNLCFKN